jgi:hypothetical protein
MLRSFLNILSFIQRKRNTPGRTDGRRGSVAAFPQTEFCVRSFVRSSAAIFRSSNRRETLPDGRTDGQTTWFRSDVSTHKLLRSLVLVSSYFSFIQRKSTTPGRTTQFRSGVSTNRMLLRSFVRSWAPIFRSSNGRSCARQNCLDRFVVTVGQEMMNFYPVCRIRVRVRVYIYLLLCPLHTIVEISW